MNGGLEYYEWELRLRGKLFLGTMVYGLKEDISLILSKIKVKVNYLVRSMYTMYFFVAIIVGYIILVAL